MKDEVAATAAANPDKINFRLPFIDNTGNNLVMESAKKVVTKVEIFGKFC